MSVQLYLGDCLEVMRSLPENSVDTIVTDPPYGLRFMGKEWDTFRQDKRGKNQIINMGNGMKQLNHIELVEFQEWTTQWAREALRVAKPGAILLAFGGTRTYHRMVCAIEDAGFEIRDTIAWVYGSGFPKSYNIGKAMESKALTGSANTTAFKNLDGEVSKVALGYNKNNAEGDFRPNDYNGRETTVNHKLHTEIGQLWDGWGTALKPSHEPIVLAMKPLDGGFVNNALTWGVAGMWIDGGRVGTVKNVPASPSDKGTLQCKGLGGGWDRSGMNPNIGRFPANLIHDGSDEVLGCFPQTGKSSGGRIGNKGSALNMMGTDYEAGDPGYGDSGSAARFFYCAKSSRRERNNGLDGYLTVKYNNDKSNNGGLSWKDVSTVAVQLLRKVISDTEALSFNIGESGESITGQCLKDSLSTILTAISKTIESKILHSLTLSLTNEYTAGVNYEMVNGGSPAESVESLRKWILTTTNGSMELARGASNVALQMLLRTKNADAWSQATNFHSTVKPIELMRYLVRLTKTPTGGVVLDPFMGSGTTGCACALEGREFIGIEREQEYIEIAEKRIAYWSLQPGLEVE